MPKFRLMVQEVISYECIIEADTEAEVIEKFEDLDEEPELYEVDSSPLEVVTCQPF